MDWPPSKNPSAQVPWAWIAPGATTGRTWAQVKHPMLVLQGERDYQVTMDEFLRWKSALANRRDVTFHSYPTLNHLLVAGSGKSVPAEYDTPGHISEDVVRDIATWIAGLAPRPE